MKLILITRRTTIQIQKLQPMNPDQLQQMIKWLNLQILHLTESIKEAHQTNNYGREIHYEGMRDAFQKFLNKFNNTKEGKEKGINKQTRNSSI
jgi:hypothetical protein